MILRIDGSNPDLLSDQRLAQQAVQASIAAVDGIKIHLFDLINNFKGVDESTIRQSHVYYAQYRADYAVENISWSTDIILNKCEEPLRDKIRKGLVGVSEIKVGGPSVLKLILNSVMDVEDSLLRSLIKNLQTLQIKNIEG